MFFCDFNDGVFGPGEDALVRAMAGEFERGADTAGIEKQASLVLTRKLYMRVSTDEEGIGIFIEDLADGFGGGGRVEEFFVGTRGAVKTEQAGAFGGSKTQMRWKRAEKGQFIGLEQGYAPLFGGPQPRVMGLCEVRLQQIGFVVAHENGDAQVTQAGDHLTRLRAQTGNITQANDLVDLLVFKVCQCQVKRVEVAVNV